MNDLRQLAKVRDEDLAGRASGAGARALLASILAETPVEEPVEERRRRPWKRLVAAGALTAALAAAAVVGPTILNTPGTATSYANAAMDIKLENGMWVARIKDPFADPAKYEEAFHAVGLDVKLVLAPATPRMVGEIFQIGSGGGVGEKTTIGFDSDPKHCKITDPECTLVLTLSPNASGAWIKAGRPARPDEPYANGNQATAEGASLAGYKVKGKRVSEVAAEAGRRGLKVVYQIVEPQPDGGHSMHPDRQSDPVGQDWWVWDAEDAQLGVVRLLVHEKRAVRK
ncbi:hypothetical protein ACIBEJ_20995 [Nonomuraea sp. NPDC050790]|uniref:hypothetical protein n=1 Tax=Nonomuraea sp. NPDC050790 TaxID=3364371 RepID=UPI0037A5F261